MSKITKISLFNEKNIPYSLQNICFKHITNAAELELKLKSATSSDELIKILEEGTGLTWKLIKSDDEMIQCAYKDSLGNMVYLRAMLNAAKFNEKQTISIKNCLLAHGLDKTELEETLEELEIILFGN